MVPRQDLSDPVSSEGSLAISAAAKVITLIAPYFIPINYVGCRLRKGLRANQFLAARMSLSHLRNLNSAVPKRVNVLNACFSDRAFSQGTFFSSARQ